MPLSHCVERCPPSFEKTAAESAAQPDGSALPAIAERVIETTVGSVWDAIHTRGVSGPAIIYVGLPSDRAAANIVPFPVREDIRDAILRAAS